MGVDLCICNWYNYRYKLLINMLQIKIINMGKEYGFLCDSADDLNLHLEATSQWGKGFKIVIFFPKLRSNGGK